MQHELLFLNPVVHEGLNVTVRNGDKWLKAKPGDKVRIVETGDNTVLGHGTVLNSVHINYENISDYWLQFEHDPMCTNWRGLKQDMDRAYGENKWGPYVTVLFFMVGK